MTAETATDPAPGAPAPPTSLWRHGPFLRMWTGETFSWFGENIGQFVIPVLAITVLGAGEWEVGLLGGFQTLAFLVIGLPAGAWVDRWRKRTTMLRADLARALVLAAIPVLWLAGVLQFWQLLVAATLVGILSVFFDVSYQSYVPILVGRERVADANGKLESSAQVARIAGPGIAGGLLAILSAPLVLVVTAATYLLSFLALSSFRDDEVPKPKADRRPLVVEIREGLGWVFRQPLLVRIVLTTGISNLFSAFLFTLLPLLVLRDLGIAEWIWGLMATVAAVGGLLGAMFSARIAKLLGEGTVIPVSAIVFGVVTVAVPLAALFPAAAIPLLVIGEFLISASVLVYNIAQVSFRQRICPPELLGRMNASIRFLVWGVMPIGGFLAGGLASAVGILPILVVGVIGTTLAAVPVVFSPLLGMRELPKDAMPR